MDAASSPSKIVFDQVEIDLGGRWVRVAGDEVALEPKAFDVLVLLAGHPGRAFSRDEILDAVWGHRHITPGVLNRIVTLLRHALGESALAVHYLHTLHGHGYRFDLPELPQLAPEPVPDPPGMAAKEIPAADAGAVSQPMVVVEGAGVQVSAAGTVRLRRLPERRRRSRLGWAMLLVAVVSGLAVLLLHPYRHAAPAVSTVTMPVLLVQPLKVIDDGAADKAFADGLSEELITLLARIPELRVISYTSAQRIFAQGADAPELTHQLGITHMLEGSVRQSGTRIRIALRLTEVASAHTLWSETFDREFADIFQIQSSVAQAVSTALALNLSLTGPGGATSSGDPLLFRRYLEARHLQWPDLHGGAGDAVAAFRKLVADAPAYPRAYGGLAFALTMQAIDDPPHAEALRREAAQAAGEALRLDPTLADPYASLADSACRTGDWERCIALSRRAVELGPSDSTWRTRYAMQLANLGYLALARAEMETAIATDPLSPKVLYFQGRLLDTQGQHEAARHYLVAAGKNINQAGLWFNAVWRHDLADATRIAQRRPNRPWRDSEIAVTAALIDPRQWPQARLAIEEAERANGGYFNFHRSLLPQPDIARDIAGYERVWKLGYSSMYLMLWNPEFAGHRRDPAFYAYLKRNGMIEYWRAHGWPDRCRLDGAGVRCT